MPFHWFKHLLISQGFILVSRPSHWHQTGASLAGADSQKFILVSRPSHWPQTAAFQAGADGLQTRNQFQRPLIVSDIL